MVSYLRTAQDPEQIFTSVRRRVHDLDSNLPVFDMITLERQMEDSLVTEHLVALLSTGFGFLATALAAIGLYGVMAFAVARRTREIGIRLAIWVTGKDVLWLVLREVLLLLGVGIAIGLAGRLGPDANRALTALWYSAIGSYVDCLGGPRYIGRCVLGGLPTCTPGNTVDPVRALRYE